MAIPRGEKMNKKREIGMNTNRKCNHHIKSLMNYFSAFGFKLLPVAALFFILFLVAVRATDVVMENGRVESTSGGFKFPDGTIQTTAYTGPGASGGGWTDEGNIVILGTISDSVGIGTASPSAPLNIVGNSGDSNAGTLILGPTSSTNLRIGYNAAGGYSWIQSHFGQP